MQTAAQNPKISVIVPVYNASRLLRECLLTVQEQTLKELEIICVDDGSTDNSLALLREIAAEDERVVVISQENKRQGAARNNGFDHAKGDYILYFDADDKLESECCERLYETAVRTDSDLACMSVLRIKSNQTRWIVRFDEERIYEGLQEKFEAVNIPSQFTTCNMLYRHAWLQSIGLRFAENVQYEDVMYASQAVANARRIVTVPGPYYNYFKREGSTMTARQTIKQQEDRYVAARAFVDYADRIGLQIPRSARKITKRNLKWWRFTWLKIVEVDRVQMWRLFGVLPIWRSRVE